MTGCNPRAVPAGVLPLYGPKVYYCRKSRTFLAHLLWCQLPRARQLSTQVHSIARSARSKHAPHELAEISRLLCCSYSASHPCPPAAWHRHQCRIPRLAQPCKRRTLQQSKMPPHGLNTATGTSLLRRRGAPLVPIHPSIHLQVLPTASRHSTRHSSTWVSVTWIRGKLAQLLHAPDRVSPAARCRSTPVAKPGHGIAPRGLRRRHCAAPPGCDDGLPEDPRRRWPARVRGHRWGSCRVRSTCSARG